MCVLSPRNEPHKSKRSLHTHARDSFPGKKQCAQMFQSINQLQIDELEDIRDQRDGMMELAGLGWVGPRQSTLLIYFSDAHSPERKFHDFGHNVLLMSASFGNHGRRMTLSISEQLAAFFMHGIAVTLVLRFVFRGGNSQPGGNSPNP